MKRYIRSGILALSLSALPLGLSALAQTGGQGYQGYQDRTTTTTREGRGSDWGWIGLLLACSGWLVLLAAAGRRLLHATARANIAQAQACHNGWRPTRLKYHQGGAAASLLTTGQNHSRWRGLGRLN